ncbi:MAG: hypothetical protein ABIB43_04145 [archaeon]
MPLCGFNKKMLEGLIAFHEGLVEHGLMDRAKKKKQSINQTLEDELKDMNRFLNELYRMDNLQMRKITENLTKYAKSFYEIIGTQGIDNYKSIVQELNEFYRKMDEKYYSELENKEDDMIQLAEYLNSQKI